MRGFVSSAFCLFTAAVSAVVFALGMHWIAVRQMGEMDGILLLASYLLAGMIFACRGLFADFEPLSITRGRRQDLMLG